MELISSLFDEAEVARRALNRTGVCSFAALAHVTLHERITLYHHGWRAGKAHADEFVFSSIYFPIAA